MNSRSLKNGDGSSDVHEYQLSSSVANTNSRDFSRLALESNGGRHPFEPDCIER